MGLAVGRQRREGQLTFVKGATVMVGLSGEASRRIINERSDDFVICQNNIPLFMVMVRAICSLFAVIDYRGRSCVYTGVEADG